MFAWLRMFAAIGVAAFACACAQLPSDTKLKAFASGVDATANVLATSVEVNRELAQRISEEVYAQRFISRKDVAPNGCGAIEGIHKKHVEEVQGKKARTAIKNVDRSDCGYELPLRNVETISREEIKPRIDLIEAINKYAKALAEASDNGTVEELESAAVVLGTAVGSTISPLLGSAAIPLLSPLVKLTSRGIGLAAGNAYAIEIRTIVARTDEPLQMAVAQLRHTIGVIRRNNKTKFNTWVLAKKAFLQNIRAASPEGFTVSSRSEAGREFREAASEARLLEAKIALLNEYEGTLDAMAEAHAKLLEGGEDADRALSRFVGLATEFGDIVPLLKKK